MRYWYRGPVLSFGRIIKNDWRASTIAVSESKAKSNFAYQYKKENKLTQNAKIELPGKIISEIA